jgi:quinohemoprotein ethanol dehydrogenase
VSLLCDRNCRHSAQACGHWLAVALSLGLSWVPACVHAGLPADPQAAAESGDNWAGFGRTYDEQHYSPLADINSGNISRLGLVWSVDIPGLSLAVSTPLEVDGVVYFAVGYSVVRALDAATGRLLWTYDPHVAAVAGEKLRAAWGIRGLGFWRDRVIVGTHDGRLIAIESKTGRLIWSVMTTGMHDKRYITGPPLVFKDKVLIGHAGADVGPVRGYVTAYDAATGRRRWRFYTVPGDPSKGFESEAMRIAARTWTGEWWKFGGGGTAWNAMTYDQDLDRVYIGTGNGAPWNQRIRSPGGGDNLFLCSIVALDADSGRYVWHYQINPGEMWDYTATMDIELATLQIDGKPRRVLMEAPKNGFFYVIDRDDGKLISAEKIAKVNWAERIDLQTGRPVETPNARYVNGPFLLWPGGGGAHSWQPMSFNAGTGLVYIPAMEIPGLYSDAGVDRAHWSFAPGMVPNLGIRMELGGDVPKDAGSSSLLAWDPVKQQAAWRIELPGIWNGGTASTAGNLVFQGRADGKFVAYAADTGKQLWSFDAQAGIVGAPITYRLNGRQYVSVLAGYGASGASFGTLAAQFGWDGRTQRRRVLTFALDGSLELPHPPALHRAVAVEDPNFVADPAVEQRGGVIYGDHCFICHGAGVVAGGNAPDLRESPAIVRSEAFAAIVKNGALLERGMPRFAELSRAQLEDLRGYLRLQAKMLRSNAAAAHP